MAFGHTVNQNNPTEVAQFKANMAKAQAANQGYDAANASPAPTTPTDNSSPTPPPPPADTPPQTSPQGSPQGGDEVKCPHCSGSMLVKKMGKVLSYITGFFQKCFSIKIPTGVLNYIKDHTPVSKTAALKGPCKSCGGKGTIKDPARIAAPAAEKVKANFQKNAKDITELENKLAPHGGNRYTVIQGSEVLEVGLGFNDAPSYTVIEGAGRRNKALVAHSDLSSKGAPMFFEGAECNYVQGINSVASPGGHYFIKCSNRFSVAAGTQGIDLTTAGPVTITGGITRISGPEVTIGGQTGPLSLEGEVVHINGKSVEIATSDGDLCVRGNISSSSNVRVGGGLHAEHVSFVTADCVGYNSYTDSASMKELGTLGAMWGSAGIKGIIHASLELANHAINIVSEPTDIKNAIGPAAINNLIDKIKNIAYQSLPVEVLPTGFILPGTPVTFLNLVALAGTVGDAAGEVAFGPGEFTVGPTPIPLFNFPHTHKLSDQGHSHPIRLPAIDFSADTSEQLRAKQSKIHMPAPVHTATSAVQTFKVLTESVGSIAAGATKLAIAIEEKALSIV